AFRLAIGVRRSRTRQYRLRQCFVVSPPPATAYSGPTARFAGATASVVRARVCHRRTLALVAITPRDDRWRSRRLHHGFPIVAVSVSFDLVVVGFVRLDLRLAAAAAPRIGDD